LSNEGGGGRRTGEAGQALVEFALVVPVLCVLFLGLVAAAWVLFEYEAVANAAQAGAREAIVETALLGSGGCESGQPRAIEAAVQSGAMIVPVDANALCQSSTNPAELVQVPSAAGEATVTVVGTPSLNPVDLSQVTVTVTLPVTLLRPLPQVHFDITAQSTLAVQ
jgi:hypothetical protein